MGEKGEGSGGEGGGKWGERGRELGMGYPPVHPLTVSQNTKNGGESIEKDQNSALYDRSSGVSTVLPALRLDTVTLWTKTKLIHYERSDQCPYYWLP